MIQIDISPIEIVPYVRMTQKDKWKASARRYLSSQNNLAWELKKQMQEKGYEMIPNGVPLHVVIRYHAPTNPGHKADLDNQVKAVCDACKNIVFEDDHWVDKIDAERTFIEGDEQPRLRMNVLRLDYVV